MRLDEYAGYDAVGLAQLVRKGEVAADEVLGTARAAIEAVNPELNAIVDLFDEPLPAATGADAPFAGVPFLLKDLVCGAEGVPTLAGSRLLAGAASAPGPDLTARFRGAGVVAPADTHLMARFRRAGLRTLGRTTTPEFGFNASTESVLTGPTRNPWDTTQSSGGSSGGSGVLVAARAVPVAHANDGGGSIRIPAAANGLVGLKPTRGRTPIGPAFAEALNGLAIEFAVTRTVRDCAALLDAVAGPEVGEKYLPPEPRRPFSEEVGAAGGTLRVAFTTEAWSGAPVDAECKAAVEELAAQLESLGHRVTEASPSFDVAAYDVATVRIWTAFLAATVATYAQMTGNAPSSDTLEATVLACYEAGTKMSALELMEADVIQNQVTRAVASFFVDHDVLLTPTMAHPTFPLGLLDANDPSLDAAGWTEKVFRHCPFTALFNMTGQPAINVPFATTADGRPAGTQLVGRFGEEGTLIGLAAQVEEARPWIDRKPAVCVG